MTKFSETWFRSYVLSLLIKANAPHNEVTAEEDQKLDWFIDIQWDINNNLNIRYSDLTDHINEAFLKELLEEEVKHYLEHLKNIGIMKQGPNKV